MKKGYLQVYTGNGKGKTTASLGVCLRALACGMKVFYMQFIKGGDKLSSEFEILKKFPEQFTYRSCGRGCFIFRDPEDIDIASAKEGLKECLEAMNSGQYDLMVLDEANCAVSAGLFTVDELLAVLDQRPENLEVIVTGRGAAPEITEVADLVTEMRDIKHYADQGVTARKGIEM